MTPPKRPKDRKKKRLHTIIKIPSETAKQQNNDIYIYIYIYDPSLPKTKNKNKYLRNEQILNAHAAGPRSRASSLRAPPIRIQHEQRRRGLLIQIALRRQCRAGQGGGRRCAAGVVVSRRRRAEGGGRGRGCAEAVVPRVLG